MKYQVMTEEALVLLLNTPDDEMGKTTAEPFSILVGKTISKVLISKESDIMGFVIAGSPEIIYFQVMGDCRSETRFADIFGFNSLLNSTILSVAEIDLDHTYCPDEDRVRQYEDKVYGYRVWTSMGCAVISFRNSSNGYYGGWCERLEQCNDALSKIVPDHFGIWQSEYC